MGPYAVRFNKNGYGARVFTDPKSFPADAIISPDISSVIGRVSPSHWKLDANGIHPMTEEEIEKHIEPIVQSEWNSGPNMLSAIDDLRVWQEYFNTEFEIERESLNRNMALNQNKMYLMETSISGINRKFEVLEMNVSVNAQRFWRGLNFLFVLLFSIAIAAGVLWLRK